MKTNSQKIKMLVMDVDGTLTDGKIYEGGNGEVFKAFDVKDGYRIINMKEYAIVPVIITGKTSDIVERRAADLKVEEVHQGVNNKVGILNKLLSKYSLDFEQVAYIGDDINDIACMKLCGLSSCPSDSVKEVKDTADYVCSNRGGNGAVREFIDLIIARNINV